MCFNILWHLEVPPKSSRVSEEGRKRRTKKPVEGGEHGERRGGGGGGGGEVGRGVGGERGVRGVRISRGIPSGHRVPIRPKPIMSIYFSLGRHQSLPGWSPGTSGVNIIPENSKRWNIGSRPPPCFHLHKHCEPAEAISRLQDWVKFTFGPGIAPPVADWMYLEVSEFLREPAPGGKDDDDHGDDADIGDDHIDDAPGGKDNDDYYDDGDGYDEPGGNDNDDDGDHQACTWWRNSEGVTSSSWTSRRQKVVGLQPWIIFNRADHLEVILKPPWVRCWVASLSFWHPVLSSLRTPSVGSQWFLFLPVQCLSYKWKNQFGQGPQSVFFAIHENPRSSAFSGVFSLFKATLFLPHIGAVLQEVLASSQRFFSFHSSLSHGKLSTDSTVNTLYLKRGHKLLEVSARLNAEVRAELKITHFREPQVRRVQVNTKLARKKANYTAVPEFILDKCLVFPSKWWYLRHTRNLRGKTGGISKLEYFVEALKGQVAQTCPVLNAFCAWFARLPMSIATPHQEQQSALHRLASTLREGCGQQWSPFSGCCSSPVEVEL